MSIIVQGYRGSLPQDYSDVWRWASKEEVNLWKKCTSHIPLDLISGEHVYVTRPNTPKPGVKGQYLIEFSVPERMLFAAGNKNWAQIFGPVGNTPVLNLRITGPHP